DHHREVQPDVWVEDRRPDRGGAVDDREHWRCHNVGVSSCAGAIHIEMDRVGLAHGARVLLDLLPADRVQHGLVGLADCFCVDWHRSSSRYVLVLSLVRGAPVYAHDAPRSREGSSRTRCGCAPASGAARSRPRVRRSQNSRSPPPVPAPISSPSPAPSPPPRSPSSSSAPAGLSRNCTLSATTLTAWRRCWSAASHSRQSSRPSIPTRLPLRMYWLTLSPDAP